jgi:hypothetical protein
VSRFPPSPHWPNGIGCVLYEGDNLTASDQLWDADKVNNNPTIVPLAISILANDGRHVSPSSALSHMDDITRLNRETPIKLSSAMRDRS